VSAIESTSELLTRAASEVDASLLEWYRGLSLVERLRAASRNAALLERMARAASRNR
jgi:hypothetical protein